jgi:conserved oligomeric Golgi complex subunit 2
LRGGSRKGANDFDLVGFIHCSLVHFFNVDLLDHVSSLERCAHTTLFLVQDLQSSTDKLSALTARKVVTPKGEGGHTTTTATSSSNNSSGNSGALPSLRTQLEDDTERAQFLMKLAPRVRRLESDTVISLTHRMEQVLRSLQQRREGRLDDGDETAADQNLPKEEDLLLMIGHCMRGLAFLGRGKEVESVFARVAVM